ncbi:MAG: type IV CRISPR-associated protein Csf2 [Betaproteobacteria bacterium]|nr:type IV CRISPR-associated protein Csf2 [Betaproteobacteria bacterium]
MKTETQLDIKKVRIALEVTAVSPIHITALESGRYLPDSRRVVASADSGFPCTLTRKVPVVRVDPMMQTKDGEDKKLSPTVDVPVIPSSTLCGKLRNAAAELIERSFVDRKERISPETFATMRSGSATTSMRRDELGVAMSREGANDPFFGVFGGTSFGLKSHLVVHEGFSVTHDTAPILPWNPLLLKPIPTRDTLGVLPIIRKNQIFEMMGQEHLVKLLGEDALMGYLSETTSKQAESKAKKAAGEKGKKEDLRTVAATQVIVPGVGFVWTFDLTYRNPAQLGLLLMALREVVNAGQVGGREAKGCGRFRVDMAKLFPLPKEGQGDINVFTPPVEGQSRVLSDSEVVAEAVLAADTFLETVTAAHYERYAADDAPLKFKEAAK